jgi:DNA-binding response OmpR family regulator
VTGFGVDLHSVTSVLLVDDEHDLLSLLDFNLRAAEFDTPLATTEEQALSVCAGARSTW